MLVVIQPGTTSFRLEALLPLGAALFYALTMLISRRMTRDMTTSSIMFWSSLGAALATLTLMPSQWQTPGLGDLGLFLFMRYAMNAPTSWTSETIMMLVATAWLMCVGAVTQQRRHITVTTMELLVGEKNWKRMQKIAILLSMIGVAGMIWMLWGPMVKVLNQPQTSGSAFDPMAPTYIKTLFVVAGVLYFAQLLANLLTPSKDLAAPTELGVE